MQLSANFTLADVMRSDTATKLGINNAPSAEVIERATDVAVQVLEKIAQRYGVANVVINSWYRSEALERNICEAAYQKWCKANGLAANAKSWATYFAKKQHPAGNAVDLEVNGVGNRELFEWIKANLVFDQLILEFHKSGDPRSGWVHVSHVAGVNRKQAFTIG